jgi:hypothetical protein
MKTAVLTAVGPHLRARLWFGSHLSQPRCTRVPILERDSGSRSRQAASRNGAVRSENEANYGFSRGHNQDGIARQLDLPYTSTADYHQSHGVHLVPVHSDWWFVRSHQFSHLCPDLDPLPYGPVSFMADIGSA